MVSASSSAACYRSSDVFGVAQEAQVGIGSSSGSLSGPIPGTSCTACFFRDNLEINDSHGKICVKATTSSIVHRSSEEGRPHLWISFFDGKQETFTALFQTMKKYVLSCGCEENQLCVFDGCGCGPRLQELGMKESPCDIIDPPDSWGDQYAQDMYGARSCTCFRFCS